MNVLASNENKRHSDANWYSNGQFANQPGWYRFHTVVALIGLPLRGKGKHA